MTDGKYYVVVALLVAAIVVPSAFLNTQTHVLGTAMDRLQQNVAGAPADATVAETQTDVAYDADETLPPDTNEDLVARALVNDINRPTGPIYCPKNTSKQEIANFLAQYFVGRTAGTIKDYYVSFLGQFRREQGLPAKGGFTAQLIDNDTFQLMQTVCKGTTTPQGVSISKLSPEKARKGHSIIVEGTGFTPKENRVLINGTLLKGSGISALKFKSFNDGTAVIFTANLDPGTYEIKIGNVFGVSNGLKLTITGDSKLKLTRLISEAGFTPGHQVTAYGTGFSKTVYTVHFRLNDKDVTAKTTLHGSEGPVSFNLPNDLKTNVRYEVWISGDDNSISNSLTMFVKPQ